MDAGRVSELSRRVAAAATRRQAVGVVATTVAAGMAGRAVPGAAAAVGPEGIPIVNCKPALFKCQRDTNCCLRRCKRGVCQCGPRGHDCWQPLEGGGCCSGRCRKGRCT